MGIRRTFLNFPDVSVHDAEGKARCPLVVAVQAGRPQGSSVMRGGGAVLREGALAMPPRKVGGSQQSGDPYRKPTQVDGSSRPRCARETTLRNSAK